jgi:hypothetical protein
MLPGAGNDQFHYNGWPYNHEIQAFDIENSEPREGPNQIQFRAAGRNLRVKVYRLR